MLAFKKGITHANDMGLSADEKDVFTPTVKAFIEKWSFEKSQLITGTTKDMLKEKLQNAIEDGTSSKDFAKTISDLYGEMTTSRSLTTARTELTGAIGYGTHETLQAEGETEHEWSTVMDGRERDSHAEADGQVVPIGEPFKLAGGDAMFPGDPSLPPEESCNCRCAEVMAGLSEDRKRVMNDQFLRVHGALEARLVVSLHRYYNEQRDRVLSHFPS